MRAGTHRSQVSGIETLTPTDRSLFVGAPDLRRVQGIDGGMQERMPDGLGASLIPHRIF